MFFALAERKRLARAESLLPFACLIADGRNHATSVKYPKRYTAEDFMPKQRVKEIHRGPLPGDVYLRFAAEAQRAE